tara:strand:+ start:76 stop:465 length:390 start_codon:yes stop_codon:yes gene_type:complete
MLKQKYFASEQHYLCDVCGEAVTTPLCPICLTEEIDAWTTLYPNLRSELLPELKRYLKRIEKKIHEATKCIKCKNKRASVCTFCFTDYVLGELKKISSNSRIIREFIDFFDFDTEPPNPHEEKWGRPLG